METSIVNTDPSRKKKVPWGIKIKQLFACHGISNFRQTLVEFSIYLIIIITSKRFPSKSKSSITTKSNLKQRMNKTSTALYYKCDRIFCFNTQRMVLLLNQNPLK
ncbi:hypothetical protein GOODEAATRI_005617 [Goodea atripinnis]|uniref:Uncharacterized protein n=1 Tax=Goodea atripinnis TaxID=208336 RepID=A0ABV0PLI3_9TELE